MKAKIYIGAKKYALYIGRKIVQKTLEFLSLPARFVSKKVQELKNLTMWGQSVQDGIPTPTAPIEIESVGDKSKNLFDKNSISNVVVRADGITRQGVILDGLDGSYTISFARGTTILSDEFCFKIIDVDGTYGQYYSISSPRTLTVSKGQKLIIYSGRDGSIFNECWTNVQIEEGSQATSYEPYGYKVPVEVSGKNLFDKDNLSVVGKPWCQSSYIKVKPNTTYTCCNATPSGSAGVKLYDINKQQISMLFYSGIVAGGNFTFTTTSNTHFVIVYANNDRLDTFQFLEGGYTASQTPSYTPYVVPTTTNIYLNEPLRRIGEYADTMSVDGTEITVVRNVRQDRLSSASNWQSDINRIYLKNEGLINLLSSFEEGYTGANLLCSHYLFDTYIKAGAETKLNTFNAWSLSGTTNKFLRFGTDMSLEEFKTFLDTNDVEVTYPLATPITETYTIENPIQFEQGTLTIDTATVIKPSKINITGDIDNE